MFNRTGKKSTAIKTKPLNTLIAVESPVQLLSDGKRQELLLNITQSSALDPARFDRLCLSLIHNVTNHCQHLPESANNYYAEPCGLLDHSLNRTEAALHLFRQFVAQGDDVDLSEEQKLWMYALFSASLLQGLGKLQIDYRVDLFDMNGQCLKQWDPLLEKLGSPGGHYQYEFMKNHDDDLRCRLNLFLARQLMPASGFAWIASNPQVLATWLALLNEDNDSAGTMGAILDRAHAISIQRYLSVFVNRGAGVAGSGGARVNRASTFIDAPAEPLVGKERALGAEFVQWLAKELASGRIPVNRIPLLMVVQGGMLMSIELFKRFILANPQYNNWQVVQHAFLALGLHRVGADGNILSRFEPANKEPMLSGIVVDTALLPDQVHLYDAATAQSTEISAIELVHLAKSSRHIHPQLMAVHSNPLPHLSVTGQWGRVEAKTASLSSGMKSRG